MPKATITESYVHRVKKKKPDKDVWHYDIKQPAFVLVQRAGGRMSFYCWPRPAPRKKLGNWPKMTVEAARKACVQMANRTELPTKKISSMTYGEYRKQKFDPNYKDTHRSHRTLNELNAFKFLEKKKLGSIHKEHIEAWISKRLGEGVQPGTINRGLNMLRSVLNSAVKDGFLLENSMGGISRLDEPDAVAARYLKKSELKRLKAALGHPEDPPYLEPMVILSLYSGLRQNELFRLRWDQIVGGSINVESFKKAGGQARPRNVPLPKTARKALKQWRKAASSDRGLVFPSPTTGQPLTNVRKSWGKLLERAEIENFRWHDMRHHYASSLVMKGVSLYKVQQLLGHSSFEMTQRYAHLNPAGLKKDVEVLG